MTHPVSKLQRSFAFRAFGIALLSLLTLPTIAKASDLEQWLQHQLTYSTEAMIRNIGPSAEVPEAAVGSVVASPSYDPYYRYFWVRDAALTLDTVVDLYQRAYLPAEKARDLELLLAYAEFSRRNQLTSNPSGGPDGFGLGEPKFNIDGSAFTGPWARPQNDGPALRARTLIRLARILLEQGRADLVRTRLYDSAIPTQSVIKADLEFVAHHWRDSSFDLWEEVRGDHFYTRLAQRRALIEGADLAQDLADGGAAQYYRTQAREIEESLGRHWDSGRGYLAVTLNRTDGLDYKSSGLDVAIILGALHAAPIAENPDGNDGFFTATDGRILATADRVSAAFRQVFPINSRERDRDNLPMAPGIGRYPEDRYSGTNWQNLGNPWFLATHAFAELYYRCASTWEARGQIPVDALNAGTLKRLRAFSRISVKAGEKIPATDPRFRALIRGLREEGDGYLRRSRYHADAAGPMSEQFNRDTGFMQSARELTWSHASVLTTAWARAD